MEYQNWNSKRAKCAIAERGKTFFGLNERSCCSHETSIVNRAIIRPHLSLSLSIMHTSPNRQRQPLIKINRSTYKNVSYIIQKVPGIITLWIYFKKLVISLWIIVGSVVFQNQNIGGRLFSFFFLSFFWNILLLCFFL